jgi:hypothetical protein
VIDEISEFPDDSELVSEDSNSFLFLVNSFNLTFPENLQLEAKYKNINDNDLLAAIQARNDFMRQKANLSLSLTKIITAFLQTLAYRMFELSSTENKPTAFDVYKFETAIAVMTTAVTLQLNGDYLPSVKTIFAILPTFDAKANKDGVAIESDIAKDPEVVALLAKKKEEKLAKESAASAAVAAAAQANSAAANKSLLTSLAATTKK